ncbi:MAG: PEP-CTERM sorting domain-containing protein [Microcoleus sp. SIO2G3]|nr:PEP-CTERM sorting domain-containing protein [Microcoleus sp. SIO2G3]
MTTFIVTGGVWAYFGTCVSAQSTGRLTVNPDSNLIIIDNTPVSVESSNLVINSGNGSSISVNPQDSIPTTAGGNISINASNLVLTPSHSGGNISLNAKDLKLVSVPEPSSILGMLATAAVITVSVLKRKQKNS